MAKSKLKNSRLKSDGFSRFPHKMWYQNAAHYDWEAWYYEEPQGFSVCVRELPNGPTVMFDIPRRAIATWVRHDGNRRSRSLPHIDISNVEKSRHTGAK